MEFRRAFTSDLIEVKKLYREIVDTMRKQHLDIWDEIYPCDFIAEDIENKRLYLILADDEIVASFALCSSNAGESSVQWHDKNAKSFYVDRLGVNPSFSRMGFGSLALSKAIYLAKNYGAEYLRLFVVDANKPAINLYRKCGFEQVEGVYVEQIDKDYLLTQYGFEICLKD